jgi:hypothetical protein
VSVRRPFQKAEREQLSPLGRQVRVYAGSEVLLFDVATGEEKAARFEGQGTGDNVPLGFSHDGRLLAGTTSERMAPSFGPRERRLVIWDTRTGKVLKSWEGQVQVAFAPDRPVLAMLENTSHENNGQKVAESVLALWDVSMLIKEKE